MIPSSLRQNLLFNVYMLERIHYHFILSRHFENSRWILPSAFKMVFSSLSRHVLPGWMLKGWISKLPLKLQHSNNIHVNFRPTMVYLCLIFYSILIDFFIFALFIKG